jgi:hypothetical protein
MKPFKDYICENVNKIPEEFSSITPTVVKWALDKMKYSYTPPEKDFQYHKYSWSFAGHFKTAPKEYYEMKTDSQGNEYHVIVSVKKPHYKGDKPFIAISMDKYEPV